MIVEDSQKPEWKALLEKFEYEKACEDCGGTGRIYKIGFVHFCRACLNTGKQGFRKAWEESQFKPGNPYPQ